MLKKIFLLSTISLVTLSNAYADTVPYVGASLGITNNSSDVKVVEGALSGGAFRGMPVDVFAGYGGVINYNFYLAGELFFTLTTPVIDNSGGVLKTSYGYGLSALPGAMLTDHTLAYFRLGLVRSRFSSLSDTRTGAQFGFGMQTSFTQNIDLRGEYDYVAYRSVNYNLGATTTSITPRSDQVHIALIYKFD